MDNRINLIGLNKSKLQNFVTTLGGEKFRASQILQWIYKNRTLDINQMTNLPAGFRVELLENSKIVAPQLDTKQISKDGTKKYLFRLEDNESIETVLIPHEKKGRVVRNTLCISSQVGCSIGCVFCASGKSGLTRNLTVSEIVGQVFSVEKIEGERITNIVFMGMGEPFLNYSRVLESVKIFTAEDFLNISSRKITISTSGIVPAIKKLAETNLQIVLAISLHSAENETRDYLVPINKKYPLEKVIDACSYYTKLTNRKVTFEYVLIEGVNDSRKDAFKLASLLKGLLCNVNLIPVNKTCKGIDSPESNKIADFKSILESYHIECAMRTEKGSDIDAACGQLKGRGLRSSRD